MRINSVLVWISYVSVCLVLGGVLFVVANKVPLSANSWVSPVATLLGGLGGALAGTWISGNNSMKIFKEQERLNQLRITKVELTTRKKEIDLLISIVANPSTYFQMLNHTNNKFLGGRTEFDEEDSVIFKKYVDKNTLEPYMEHLTEFVALFDENEKNYELITLLKSIHSFPLTRAINSLFESIRTYKETGQVERGLYDLLVFKMSMNIYIDHYLGLIDEDKIIKEKLKDIDREIIEFISEK